MIETPDKPRRGAGRVAFLAHAEDFRKLVEAGHPLLAIYERHQGLLGISYSQFARYVARYIRSPSPEQKAK
ncbi:TraK family protein [Pseudomonas sp. NPDC098747]|uniref:TraK family protein n=1 Tax=Pseudomonas sp. NPDC098747 TaxID=3364487 RepID=UPI00383AFDDA